MQNKKRKITKGKAAPSSEELDSHVTNARLVKLLFAQTRKNIDTLLNVLALGNVDTSITLDATAELKAHIQILAQLRISLLPKIKASQPSTIIVEDKTSIVNKWV
jgi:hypothetical protein